MKNRLLTALLMLSACFAYGQARPDIASFSSGDRTTLVTLMQQYITIDIIKQHCDYTAITGDPAYNIHDDFNFLPFHRMYIEGMEDYLLEQGYPQFVPLPSWDPNTCTPTEFQVVDPDCAATACSNFPGGCGTPSNWCPSQSLPSSLSLPVQPGGNNDICDWNFSPTVPLGVDANGLSRRIETPYHDNVHVIMSGAMGAFRSPGAPIFWLWHAYTDDLWKAWEEHCPQSTVDPVDLYMKDTHKVVFDERDRGEEPNPDTGPMWKSEDIWVRNQNDGLTNHTHQNPEYQMATPVFVYVRVRNRGFQSSLGTEQVSLYWAKANTGLGWPAHWNGTTDLDPGPAFLSGGDIIGTQTPNVIQAGDQTILEFVWTMPNPADYAPFNPNQWHFCLLARIVAANDPMTFPEGAAISTNVRNNNNIIWKNLTLVDNIAGILPPDIECVELMEDIGVAVAISNPLDRCETFNVEFSVPASELPIPPMTGPVMMHDFEGNHWEIDAESIPVEDPGTNITEEATVMIAMDERMYNVWMKGGGEGSGFKRVNTVSTSERPWNNRIDPRSLLVPSSTKLFEITDINAKFENLKMEEAETFTTSLMVLYPGNPVSEKEAFEYEITQTVATTGEAIGGVHYNIAKPVIEQTIDAGENRTIDKRCNTVLTALPQAKCMNYWWINNSNGRLVAYNTDAVVAPASATTYTLKAITREGIILQDEVTVNVSNQLCPAIAELLRISPNPVRNKMTIRFRVGSASSVQIMLMNTSNGMERTFQADPAGRSLVINASNYPSGTYSVLLIADGVVKDTKNIIIR